MTSPLPCGLGAMVLPGRRSKRAQLSPVDSCTVWFMNVRDGITIDAPAAVVWDVFRDVERWPTWTASVASVELVEGTEVALGAKSRIKQPGFPHVVWTVTAVEPGAGWT